MNLDNQSFRLNFEVMAVLFDERLAGEVEKMLETNFREPFLLEQSLSVRPCWIRVAAPFARLFAPLL